MGPFFAIASAVSLMAYAFTMAVGFWPELLQWQRFHHMLFGLGTALGLVGLHCLVFGIFTGSGKDARLLVQDHSLNQDFIKRTKIFKRTIFPPALYAIGWILVTSALGGGVAAYDAVWLRWVHQGLAWFTFFYNAKTLYRETRAIYENAAIIKELNQEAIKRGVKESESSVSHLPTLEDGTELEWGAHVYAFGKFLCFMGYNVWLPYIYFQFIMQVENVPTGLFIFASLLFLCGGYYLRLRYSRFRPKFHGRSGGESSVKHA